MIKRHQLIDSLDSWLLPNNIKDHTINSLQFEGRELITHVGGAVDVSIETFQKAVEQQIDFLITHHGLIWGGLKQITGIDKQRIQLLCQHDINLYCSHLPLDIHPTLGNNVQLIQLLDMTNTKELFFDVGYIGIYNSQISYSNFIKKIRKKISQNITEMPFGKKMIQRVAVCSGGAGLDTSAFFEAYAKGVDTFLSGETNSLLYHYAKELEINIICAGHYATETFGIQALLKKINKKFQNIKCTFLDLPTNW
ncbi:dinuclear metal center protein, YbgI/SA1388 family [Brevinema andersonii]|uniref:GTP cyclohydrolase 1 type 2 homolog n=1 Tax=Brevinema andersonii TaxID=34097 RepID=A0A1I1D0F8_BREAD|nr:Nif3-like dinuclear metal center hexameric protein [Brevinema andersonii]SFB67806.1 dinuclear metal center protein, YbgI/SA1388 family [Brevinema andersonii]